MACAIEIDLINQLEENLQCTVCRKVLTDPRTLPCCHSFCKKCLERIVETCRGKARSQPIREFPCPYCRATFILDPDKHVADMPRNHFICNMVKVAAVLDRGIGVPCSHNCSQSYSVARCVTCEKFLCRECLTAHNNYRANNGHSVLTMEDLSKPENRKKVNDKMYCNEHSGMELKVYCETCDKLICRDCMDFKHVKQRHSCVLVKDEANKYKELLASSNKAMQKALTEENAFLEQLTVTAEQLDRDAKNAKNRIAQRKQFVAKKVLEMLDQKAESLCKEVDEIHNGKRASLDRQTEKTKLNIQNIKTSVELSIKLINQGTEEEIISSQKMILDNSNNLLTNHKEYFKAPMPVTKLRYSYCGTEPINEQILRGLANNLGEVYEEKKSTGRPGVRSSLDPRVPGIIATARNVPETQAYCGQEIDIPRLNENEKCSLCLRKTTNCFNKAFQIYRQLVGKPPGMIFVSYTPKPLHGYKSCGGITIHYKFEDGIQQEHHFKSGKRYFGKTPTAYLPDNEEGKEVLELLHKAFDQKLRITAAPSPTTGANDVITLNDIHHNTRRAGGATGCGYPNPDYLKRVQEELAVKGITE